MPHQTFWNLPDAKRRAVVEAALDEFAERSYATASVARIAARADVAKGSIYQYFADKRDLYLYLLDLAIDRQLSTLRDAAPPASEVGFFGRLRWLMSASLRVGLAHPRLLRLMHRAFADDLPFRDEVAGRVGAASRDVVGELVREGIARGDLDPELDPALAAYVVGAVIGDLRGYLLGRLGLDAERVADAGVGLLDEAEVGRVFDDLIGVLEGGLRGRRPPREQED